MLDQLSQQVTTTGCISLRQIKSHKNPLHQLYMYFCSTVAGYATLMKPDRPCRVLLLRTLQKSRQRGKRQQRRAVQLIQLIVLHHPPRAQRRAAADESGGRSGAGADESALWSVGQILQRMVLAVQNLVYCRTGWCGHYVILTLSEHRDIWMRHNEIFENVSFSFQTEKYSVKKSKVRRNARMIRFQQRQELDNAE